MIPLCHSACGPTGASWIQNELRSGDLVVFVERYRGALRDDALVPEPSSDRCSAFRFVLDGPLVACGPGRSLDLRPGDAFVSPTPGMAPFRSLTESSTVLNIGWRRGGSLGPGIALQTILRPQALTRTRLLALAEVLIHGARMEEADDAVRGALAALRADGLPFPSDELIAETCATTTKQQAVARVVELASCSLSAQPMSVDAASLLDVSEYHSLRRIKTFLREFYFSVAGWRDYLQMRRLQLGAFFMGHADARTEDVARVLGFRSPTSFCHAFHSGGLPSPREVQRRLLA